MTAGDFATRAFAAARTLAVDALAGEVVPALRAAGVRPVLLKGASLVGWLYREDEGRAYGDVDLLVAPDRRRAAEDVLGRLGFELEPVPAPAPDHPRHARTWRRARDGAAVDLHRTLPGLPVAPEEAWQVLSERLERRVVQGAEVEVLDPAARTLLVALHVAHHEVEPGSGPVRKPVADLELAVERLPESAWREAAALATRLHCRGRLGAGLRATDGGAAIARRLGLPEPGRPIRAAVERIAATPGGAARLRVAARMLVPGPATMRWHSSLARRGRLGLAAAYALRPLRLFLDVCRGLLARARR